MGMRSKGQRAVPLADQAWDAAVMGVCGCCRVIRGESKQMDLQTALRPLSYFMQTSPCSSPMIACLLTPLLP